MNENYRKKCLRRYRQRAAFCVLVGIASYFTYQAIFTPYDGSGKTNWFHRVSTYQVKSLSVEEAPVFSPVHNDSGSDSFMVSAPEPTTAFLMVPAALLLLRRGRRSS
jgi:hypothetical protein